MPGVQPAERAAVYDAMNATLARLHWFDPAAIGLADFGRGENYVARQVDRWSKQYRASRDRADRRDGAADRVAAGASAAGSAGAAGARRLPARQHHPGADRSPTILAVLDWELSTLGDPLADLAYHLMQWDMPPSETGAGTGTLVGLDLARSAFRRAPDYVDAYVARTGLDPRPHLPVYLAYNFFRLAAILQGIVGRVRDGTATSENAAAMAPLVRPLADEGLGVRARRRARDEQDASRSRSAAAARAGSRTSRCSKRSTKWACGRPPSPAPRSAR